MTETRRLTEQEVWISASAILSEHGAGSADHIIKQLDDVLGDRVAVEDWRRVAAALDAIVDAQPQ
ncbi:hypothetical protein VH567_15480 [Sphingomonas sp. 4RDLI-65]|uniref:hypothetical protein n=1 Tax=Sphingomonas sp. 4RDLI-65 TaxID=3111641 RepID=UPI003C1E9BAC